MLGSGRTAKPLIDYRPLELATHLDELLRTLDESGDATGFRGRLDGIVGHSQGAAVAVELCRLRSRDRSTRVEKLVLIDPPPPNGVRWLRSVTGLPLGARSAEIVSSLLPHRRLARLWLGFLYADRSRVTDEVLKGYTATSSGRGYAAATARALHSLAHLELKLEDAPTTALLWGAEDKVFPPSIARDWQARLAAILFDGATRHRPLSARGATRGGGVRDPGSFSRWTQSSAAPSEGDQDERQHPPRRERRSCRHTLRQLRILHALP